MKEAVFRRSDGILLAIMGVLIFAAALVGVVMLAVVGRGIDLKTVALAALGFAGSTMLAFAFLNGWRTPLLVVRPDALIIATFFGSRTIAIRTDHPLGECLATSPRNSRNTGTIEGNKFVYFFTLDDAGRLTKLVSMHRDAPDIPLIRQALVEIGGLTIETLKVNPKNTTRPDVSHWRGR